jgi:hypothetical protein
VLKEQVGVGMNKTRDKAGFRVAPLPRSVWTLLGIDMAKYATWYGSPAASGFGVLQKAIACCAPCDGAGDDVRCVRQNNVWRCVSSQTAGTPPHRQMEAPLDVCQMDTGEHKVAEEEPGLTIEEVSVAPLSTWSAVDRLAAQLGFSEGATAGDLGVSTADMLAAWSNAGLSEADICALRDAHGVDFSPVPGTTRQATKILARVNVVLQQANKVSIVQQRRRANNPSRKYLYYIV